LELFHEWREGGEKENDSELKYDIFDIFEELL
jgi:hypothetical protein